MTLSSKSIEVQIINSPLTIMCFFYLPFVFHTNLPNANFWTTALLLCVKRFYWFIYYSEPSPRCCHANGRSSLSFHRRACYFQMLLATIDISLSLGNRYWHRHCEQEFHVRAPSDSTRMSERKKQYRAEWRAGLQCSNFVDKAAFLYVNCLTVLPATLPPAKRKCVWGLKFRNPDKPLHPLSLLLSRSFAPIHEGFSLFLSTLGTGLILGYFSIYVNNPLVNQDGSCPIQYDPTSVA